MESKTWFITGASRGFGHHWALGALRRGDRVAACARNIDGLEKLREDFGKALLPIRLDVTDRSAVSGAVALAHSHFGALDVVVNNAGYGLHGFVEEVSEQQVRAQMETNFFGVLWVTQAVLPYLRRRRRGPSFRCLPSEALPQPPTWGSTVRPSSLWKRCRKLLHKR